MGPVRQNSIQRTVSLFICVCIAHEKSCSTRTAITFEVVVVHRVRKICHSILHLTLPNANRFSKLFHRQTLCQTRCSHYTAIENNWEDWFGCTLRLCHCIKITSHLNTSNHQQPLYTACCITTTRMWANAQRDGSPAKYRWRPLFNAAKFGWCPLLEYRAVTLPRRETRWNLQGYPKLVNRISAASGPKFAILSGHVEEILLFKKLFSDCQYMP